ncbi:MAG: M23 family metallopeptidase [Deltaproteobacteria bacterium]|jgi:murein DD-endopeptidase MepM/ murein hydrolase activator NlpD|nr:M23 family metallopeptidase [Deltaproteobacteria bacterium]
MSNWNQANPRFRRDRPGGRGAAAAFFAKAWAFLNASWAGERKIKCLLFVLGVVVGTFLLWRLWPHFGAFKSQAPVPPAAAPAPALTFQGPQLPPLSALPEGSWALLAAQSANRLATEAMVAEGGTVSQSLELLGLSRAVSHALLSYLEKEKALSVVRPGATFRAYWRDPKKEDSDLSHIEFVGPAGQRPLVFRPTAAGGFFRYDLAARPLTIHQATQGTVEDTFWGAGIKAGLDPRVIMSLTDLLASQIDFVSDVRAGDGFQLLFRGQYQEGRLIAPPEIEMIRMTNDGEKFEFYRHEKNGQLVGFYDANFRSIRKTFFKSPLQYARVSSGFSQARAHPILKVVRPHLGVDYAAPAGTPVSAVADGTVKSAGRRGGYGLLVVLKHGEAYETMYGHLSQIAKGLVEGAAVKQGDLIGYVGSTGLATGPHLDFRLRKNASFVDPIPEMAKQEGQPLPTDERAAFSDEVTRDQARLMELLSWELAL